MNNISISNSDAAHRIMLNAFRNILRIAIAHSGGGVARQPLKLTAQQTSAQHARYSCRLRFY